MLKRAECPNIRFHDLRHTFATLSLAGGVTIKVVLNTMDHSRTSVTMDIYAHELPSQEQLTPDQMDVVFG